MHALGLLAVLLLRPAASSYQSVIHKITRGYDFQVRPREIGNLTSCDSGESGTDQVTIAFHLNDVNNVDQRLKRFRFDGRSQLYWNDPRLAWDDDECPPLLQLPAPQFSRLDPSTGTFTTVPAWTPPISFLDMAPRTSPMTIQGQDDYFLVKSNGDVELSSRFRSHTSCGFNFGQMPFDRQWCTLDIEVLQYTQAQVRLKWVNFTSYNMTVGPSGSTIFNHQIYSSFDLDEWLVFAHSVTVGRTTASKDGGAWVSLCFNMVRVSNYYADVILIAVLLVIASYSSFFIDAAAAPARVALSFLTFLIVTTNLWAVLNTMPMLPNQSLGRCWLSDFLIGSALFCFFTIVEYAAVNFGGQAARAAAAAAAAADAEKRPAPSASALRRGLACLCADTTVMKLCVLDRWCRWLYLPAYAIFLGVLYACVPIYDHKTKCEYKPAYVIEQEHLIELPPHASPYGLED